MDINKRDNIKEVENHQKMLEKQRKQRIQKAERDKKIRKDIKKMKKMAKKAMKKLSLFSAKVFKKGKSMYKKHQAKKYGNISAPQDHTNPVMARKNYNLEPIKAERTPSMHRQKTIQMNPTQYHFLQQLGKKLDNYREHFNQSNQHDDYQHMPNYLTGKLDSRARNLAEPTKNLKQKNTPEYSSAEKDAQDINNSVQGTKYQQYGQNLNRDTRNFATQDRAVGKQLRKANPNTPYSQVINKQFTPNQRDNLKISSVGVHNSYQQMNQQVNNDLGSAQIVPPKINGFHFAQNSRDFNGAVSHYNQLATEKGSNYALTMKELSIDGTNGQTISNLSNARNLNTMLLISQNKNLHSRGELQQKSLHAYNSISSQDAGRAFVKSDGYTIRPVDHNDVQNYKYNANAVLNSKNPQATYAKLAKNGFQAPKQYNKQNTKGFATASHQYEALSNKTNQRINGLDKGDTRGANAEHSLTHDDKGSIMSIKTARTLQKNFSGKDDSYSKIINKNLSKDLSHYSTIPDKDASHLYVHNDGKNLTPLQPNDVNNISNNVNKNLSAPKPSTKNFIPNASKSMNINKGLDNGPEL